MHVHQVVDRHFVSYNEWEFCECVAIVTKDGAPQNQHGTQP
jgi:hypothetical protein